MFIGGNMLLPKQGLVPFALFETEVYLASPCSSETNLWNAVLLQLLKEAEYIRRSLENSQNILNDEKAVHEDKENAFAWNCKLWHKKKSIEVYLNSTDFGILCDYAGHNIDCVRPKILDIVGGRFSVTDNQVKRTFTRKSDKRR